jgi:hypothetical protein
VDPKEAGCENVEWIHLSQERVHWWALMNKVMNILVPVQRYLMVVSETFYITVMLHVHIP